MTIENLSVIAEAMPPPLIGEASQVLRNRKQAATVNPGT